MKKFIALIVVLFAVMISSTAAAANWKSVSRGSDCIWEIDVSSVGYDKSSYDEVIFHAFFKVIYLPSVNIFSSTPKPSYSIYLLLFKKSGNLKYVSIASSADYKFDGSVVTSGSHPTNFVPIPPDSVGEALFNAAYSYL